MYSTVLDKTRKYSSGEKEAEKMAIPKHSWETQQQNIKIEYINVLIKEAWWSIKEAWWSKSLKGGVVV